METKKQPTIYMFGEQLKSYKRAPPLTIDEHMKSVAVRGEERSAAMKADRVGREVNSLKRKGKDIFSKHYPHQEMVAREKVEIAKERKKIAAKRDAKEAARKYSIKNSI